MGKGRLINFINSFLIGQNNMDRMLWNVRGVHQYFLSIKMRDFHGNYLRHNLGGRYLDIKMGNLPLVDKVERLQNLSQKSLNVFLEGNHILVQNGLEVTSGCTARKRFH